MTPPEVALEEAAGPDPGSPDAQDIRLAVVLNGGVSLAVWISGVTHELNELVQASRRRSIGHGPASDTYGDLLGILQATARIDVIAGTSAGGINGGFLSLGLVHGCDLSGLRKLWQDQGDLGVLLRDPLEKAPPSLLRGQYFHDELAKAYVQVWGEKTGLPATDSEDVDLFLTGTLWDGRRSFFADDMGRRITETDHDATFHFTSDPEILELSPDGSGNLKAVGVTRQLAVASRCTASFPAAFEPFPVRVPEPYSPRPDGRWDSAAGRANFQRSQFVIDGGILRNKPIRPAIDAVYQQSASNQVRRILAYVVPDPGEAASGPGKSDVAGPPPGAGDVLLGVMTRLRSTDSVAAELAEIERRNDQTVQRRRARDRLAQALVVAAGADDLVRSAYAGYLEVRRDDTARSVARLLVSAPHQPPWSPAEVATELQALISKPENRDTLPFIPPTTFDAVFPPRHAASSNGDAGWPWGQATVRRLGDIVLDVLKRAVWLVPLGDPRRQTIVAQRRQVHAILEEVRSARRDLDAYWRNAHLPARSGRLAASLGELLDLRTTLQDLVAGWGSNGAQVEMTVRLHSLARDLAGCLAAAEPVLRGVSEEQPPPAVADGPVDGPPLLDRDGTERRGLKALADLLVPTPGLDAEVILRNMLRLEVVHVSFTGVSDVPEQAVELIQVSSLRKDLVTGVQLHHFGAFYRQSWRANDWLRGRVDASEQLVQMLLAPERLHQLYGTRWEVAMAALKDVAIGAEGNPYRDDLASGWAVWEPRIQDELRVLESTEPLPRTFPLTAARIAHRIRTDFLQAELDSLATAVESEPDPVEEGLRWAGEVRTVIPHDQNARTRPQPSQLAELLRRSEDIGRQSIAAEGRRGSDTFARTATKATAALTSAASSVKKPKAAVTLLKGLHGYALLLWVLVNFLAFRSNIGRNLTGVVLGVGGALVAVAILVPGVPAVVPLTGVVIVLATGSVAALRHPRIVRGLAWRVVALLILAGVGLWWLLKDENVPALLRTIATRIVLVAAIVGVGWLLGRPLWTSKGKPRPAPQRRAPSTPGTGTPSGH